MVVVSNHAGDGGLQDVECRSDRRRDFLVFYGSRSYAKGRALRRKEGGQVADEAAAATRAKLIGILERSVTSQ